ncbi:MAG: cytochrome P450 [Myxococcota bacterium]
MNFGTGLELIAPARYARDGYPHALWTELRKNAPLHYFEPEGYRGFWAVTRHADICAISKDPGRFSSEPRLTVMLQALEETDSIGSQMRTLVNMDPPDHRVYRNLATPWFKPRNLKALEERMVESARELVDRMSGDGSARESDFVTEVAALHPLRLIAHLFGLDEADEPFVLRATNEMFGAQDPEFQATGDAEADAAKLRQDFFAFFQKIANERRANPSDDLASVLAQSEVEGAPIPQLELLSYYLIVLTAGHETTRNALSGGLLALIEHPDELAKLQADIGLANRAADEIVRWTSPVNHFVRTATEDTEVAGQKIRAGESLALFYASANRDESVFEAPFSFRVDRHPNPHLGFGIGEHFCLGATLARMEIRVLLEELVPRLRRIELAGEPAKLASSFVGGLKHLPVRAEIAPA